MHHLPKLKLRLITINQSRLFANKIELSENQDGDNKLRNKIKWRSLFFHQLAKQEQDHLLQF